MPSQTLFDDADHKNILLEDFTIGLMVQSNQHVIMHKDKAMLLDPGGHKVYPNALGELSSLMPTNSLTYLFFSHQDPDVIAAANAWLMVTEAQALLPQVWTRFLMHFGVDDMMAHRITAIPDDGMIVDLAGCELLIIPAHFLHSPGNFQVYDPVSKILYSGDLGASLGVNYTVVPDFDAHIPCMENFHRRYMASRGMLRAWARMVKQLDIEMIAPQHGAVFATKEHVGRLIEWLEHLSCGINLIGKKYKLPVKK
ncbi:MAG: FprA family A-type flavoprotein [Chloroflexi bacterium]|nr:FprA family A-type flavoprotein [Chloroflexota bacterium]